MGGGRQDMVRSGVMKGCIKPGKGPWMVHRTTKDGRVITKYRFPSDRERQTNLERERNRRAVARKIFSGLRDFGNYPLPKSADTIDLLKALCEEAGWHVEPDGTLYKKAVGYEGGGYCMCGENIDTIESRSVPLMMDRENHDTNLMLSLTLARAIDQTKDMVWV